MRVALFVPCYVDQFYPQTALATDWLLRRYGVRAEFPTDQTCCGQPMANTGCTDDARVLAQRFVQVFQGYDHIVAPSGSCVSMVRNHFSHLIDCNAPDAAAVCSRTRELSEFLTEVLGIDPPEGEFPYQVGIHLSCHGLRELRLGSCSETMDARPDVLRNLLSGLRGITFSELRRRDECCGFGGTFAVNEEAVSGLMGEDRILDHLNAGTQVLTAGDMSCLMHLDGMLRRRGDPVRVLHYAEILKEAAGR